MAGQAAGTRRLLDRLVETLGVVPRAVETLTGLDRARRYMPKREDAKACLSACSGPAPTSVLAAVARGPAAEARRQTAPPPGRLQFRRPDPRFPRWSASPPTAPT